MNRLPLLTIITPSLNRASMIAGAIGSVLRQNYPRKEHLIIDGGSTDSTSDVLSRHPHLKLIGGPDKGMYDALNKGLKAAQGEIIGFLNTDDLYPQGTLDAVAGLFMETEVDAVAGQAVYFKENVDKPISFFRPSKLLAEQIFWREIIYGDPAFNAWFFHRRVFDQIGDFDVTYRIAGDRDFLMRFALSNLPYASLHKVTYHYRIHDSSLSLSGNLLQFSNVANENLRLVDRYLDSVPRNARSYLQRVRTRDTITAVSRSLRGGAYDKALYYLRVGWRYDLFWPVKFFWRLFIGIFRAMGRRWGLYPPI